MKIKCDNCGKRLDESESGIDQIDDLCKRLTPGGEVPAGQCPDCGALMYLDPTDTEATPEPDDGRCPTCGMSSEDLSPGGTL